MMPFEICSINTWSFSVENDDNLLGDVSVMQVGKYKFGPNWREQMQVQIFSLQTQLN